ncbi:MAG: hypothetical protein NXH85_00155 [Pseudomonadaceae bacterium]|nr:hypothetical protein [Pseudomonadaceae bacterium]
MLEQALTGQRGIGFRYREWLALLLTTIAFLVLNDVLPRLYRWVGVDLGMVVVVLLAAVAVLSARSAPDRSPARIMAFGCSAILGFYALMLVPGFAPDPELASVEHLHGAWRWLTVAAVVLCWRWPGFGILPVGFVFIYKAALSEHTGLAISPTDYLPIVELGLLLSLGLAFGKSLIPTSQARTRYLHWLFLLAVAAHIANYFWSGIEKLLLSEEPLYWLLNNDTSNIVLVSHVLGTLPLSGESAVALAHMVRDNVIVLNLLTLLLQLLSPIALMSRRLLIGTTLAFDISHVVIFLCSGIFFWKWILLNLVIVAAASRASFGQLNWAQYSMLPLVILFSSHIFFTAKLGWLDTPSATVSYVEAEFVDGERLRLPSNAFLAGSVTAAQIRLARPLSPSNGTDTWGQTNDVSTFERVSDGCMSSALSAPRIADFSELAGWLERHVVWQRSKGGGDVLIGASHWYPHHIFSNPGRTKAVNSRRWRDVRALHYVSELHCIAPAETAIKSSIIESTSTKIVELNADDRK